MRWSQRPSWHGPSDPMRLHLEDLGSDVVDTILNIVLASLDVPGKIAGSVRPLHQLPLSDRVDILDGMPDFTPRGLAGLMDQEVAPPARAVVGVDSSSASRAWSGEEEAATGGASPARYEPFTDEICDISSSDDDAFVVAPSRLEEEASEAGTASETGASPGRREPRTKAMVDRSGARPSDIPSKRKAATPLEGSGAKPTPSWRSPGLSWVDAGASPSW